MIPAKGIAAMASWMLGVALLLQSCAKAPEETMPTYSSDSIHQFEAVDIDGKNVSLGEYKGNVVLVVNVASKCGFTKQYAGLQELYEKYKGQGFVILGFPANNFGGQEPGTELEIKAFCSTTYGVTFPMFSKINVTGDEKHPLYAFLTDKKANPNFGGRITWNFNKFLIGPDGTVIGRFDSKDAPLSETVVTAVEAALAG